MSDAAALEASPSSRAPRAPRLHCLGGAEAPAWLSGDTASAAALPEAARRELWGALGPSLADPVTKEVEQTLEAFSVKHGLPRPKLAAVIKAGRFLVRSAASHDTSREDFTRDLAALTGGDEAAMRVLLAGFEKGKAFVRKELQRRAVTSHGRLLSDVDWRVDRIMGTADGEPLGADVVTLTLHYSEGDEKGRLSVQVTGDMLEKLKGICERFVR